MGSIGADSENTELAGTVAIPICAADGLAQFMDSLIEGTTGRLKRRSALVSLLGSNVQRAW
jgi:hypothetical protein